jgi:hypothetical protein
MLAPIQGLVNERKDKKLYLVVNTTRNMENPVYTIAVNGGCAL